MSRDTDESRLSKCLGKVPFDSRQRAERAAKRKHGSGRHAYLCSSCHAWHVGTSIASNIARRKKRQIIERARRHAARADAED